MQTAEIRRRFLDYFAARGHTIVPSAPLLYNDPTLLFVNAGMVPFKPYFTGAEDAPWPRAASVQKCVRTLDIEEVGKTTRHGTFFQMNGNFSFGDYFKEGAIEFAWELVTGSVEAGNYGFDPERIWVTVYYDDDEGADLWRKVGVPTQRIQRRGLKDNYWHMGVPGPGGPCSEIYVDRGKEFGADGGPEADEDRFLEIWNLVFQTEELSAVRAKDDFDVARPLPAKNIDTGMGLERVAYLLQGVENMYEIDEVRPVLTKAAELSGRAYGRVSDDDVRMRVVADHIRSSLMLMTDGVTPGNEARGYVLRRLLRRSIRAMRLLGVNDPVLPELLPVSRDVMQTSYPEIITEWERVSQIAYAEEEAFRRTLAAGTQIFDLAAVQAKQAQAARLSGEQAFQLHDTYGFPIDLTLEMAAEQGLSVDRDGFTKLMTEQRDRAKADAKSKKGGAVATEAYRTLRGTGEVPFLGFTELSAETKVRGIVADGQLIERATPGSVVEVVLEETPFYAEAGGQDADTGLITGDGLSLEVLDVQRPVQGLIVHKVRVADGELATGAQVFANVDAAARHGACQAHTATHIVNAALRQLLGQGTHQAGSYNKPGYLRFDFNAVAALSPAMKQELEGVANEAIRSDYEVSATEMPLTQAKALGAQAMFGEKYGETVRMVELGGPWSRELCGGTHVASTSQIGLLTLMTESSVGSGLRRVEAFVSADAFASLAKERALVTGLADLLKVQPDQVPERVARLIDQVKNAEKEIANLRAQQLLAEVPSLVASAATLGSYSYVAKHLPGTSGDDLRTLAMQVRDAFGARPGVVALVGGQGKPVLIVATSQAARDSGAKAGALVAAGAPSLGGRGGGRDDLAQGGGTDLDGAEAALSAIGAALVG
ncbi:alanine--tRNA ligase [Propionicimonas sp.]|uniref:alanine--tRNA ligase n=1 Tax=Propionicimonas sp. TaxID=1955623 RepID=UPI0017AFE7F2|nr:alanine--tRNA ligase [Propionicimonas sp.]MBU3977380.1 alanine--tRNA ligase [Actinomycetota bacterium]MBA3021304.1 alanine--tRNA ligase [Propionicimonas sp.]MBU3985890.1 alanine--tRNA ligase [Actinomycetota bacterium]MBU4008675.1 alanine--tRNA ligase [Actinomycetota bacterium]MBU4066175.1 alanine--tRNA ligase [Actinomycetota bacterium]